MIFTSPTRITFCSVSLSLTRRFIPEARSLSDKWFPSLHFSISPPWPPPGCSSAPTKRKILVQYLSQKTCTCNFFISLGETLAVTSAIILWWTFFLFLTRTDPFADQQGFCAFYLRLLPIQSQNSSEHPTYSKTCTSISTNMSWQWKLWSCFGWGKNIAGKYLAIRNWQLIPGQIGAASYEL